jgi:hypothetical protein
MLDKFVNVLPIIIMTESFLASIPLALTHRWGSAIYWFAAGLLNLSVIFFVKRFG